MQVLTRGTAVAENCMMLPYHLRILLMLSYMTVGMKLLSSSEQ